MISAVSESTGISPILFQHYSVQHSVRAGNNIYVIYLQLYSKPLCLVWWAILWKAFVNVWSLTQENIPVSNWSVRSLQEETKKSSISANAKK